MVTGLRAPSTKVFSALHETIIKDSAGTVGREVGGADISVCPSIHHGLYMPLKRLRRATGRMKEPTAIYGRSMAKIEVLPASLLEIGERFMKDLKEKARRVSQALIKAGVPHAVIGGLAVAAHIARVAPEAERNTKDLDILLHHKNLKKASAALGPLGFHFRKVMGINAFIPAGGSFRDAIHIVKSGEKVRQDYPHAAPDLPEKVSLFSSEGFACLDLMNLLMMKLTSYRLKDRVHVQDLLVVGLITSKVEAFLPSDLKARLEEVKDETARERLAGK